ncbi:Choline/Carnitine O-acyltransferase [Necator americanus]|uniref:Choline/Carnitine O-acyltransferase n=1 Tax=Necator americanus TaxID=51031 RepID=W2T1S4_NECAM|nr:Choline/Carnitine O-acyltransferase [Necator americanus]ETN75524.1 Choline/Carnitine O-acyltransferase [Necator americanus]
MDSLLLTLVRMATFSKQDELPSLPVPNLNETLDKYLRSGKGTLPVTKSRGVIWDMYQYHCLFNSCRVPEIPKDRIYRYFKTESEGDCPSHITVLCRGKIWRVEMLEEGQLKTPDELHRMRASLISNSPKNKYNIKSIEESCFCLTLTDNLYETTSKHLHASLMGESRIQWADKCMNVIACKDGRILLQADHSNVDAIVVMLAADDATSRTRKTIWKPQDIPFEVPELLSFDLSSNDIVSIVDAEKNFCKLGKTIRVKSVIFEKYGNNLVKQSKLYTDTVVQIALQLAFLKTHGSFPPIYETASTRKFYHGRTETVRGCTHEMVAFGRSVIEGKSEAVHLLKLKLLSHPPDTD